MSGIFLTLEQHQDNLRQLIARLENDISSKVIRGDRESEWKLGSQSLITTCQNHLVAAQNFMYSLDGYTDDIHDYILASGKFQEKGLNENFPFRIPMETAIGQVQFFEAAYEKYRMFSMYVRKNLLPSCEKLEEFLNEQIYQLNRLGCMWQQGFGAEFHTEDEMIEHVLQKVSEMKQIMIPKSCNLCFDVL
ncbi:MAG: hypothetical protein ACR2M9_01005 [Cyanophyceae cyanobacterium]